MKAILGMGVDASRIIFAHTIKSNASLRFAKQRGVTRMTVDSIDELDKVIKHITLEGALFYVWILFEVNLFQGSTLFLS